MQCELYIYIITQFRLAIFQVLNSHIQLVATLLDNSFRNIHHHKIPPQQL